MDKIWDRKILRSRRSLAVVAGMKKTEMTTQNRLLFAERTKIRTLKKRRKKTHINKQHNEQQTLQIYF